MNFLSPWFLLGSLAVAGPIVFHLIRRAARERTKFSSLMFLIPTPPRAVRRRKLEHLWLLLLRCLCLCLLAVGFARPFFARDVSPPLAASQERRVVLLLDTSASMRREGLWEKARARADDYLDKATPYDQIAVMTFDAQPRTLVSFADWNSWPESRRATLARQRMAAAAPGWMGTRMGVALTEAAEQFRQNAATRREIILITDLQEGANLDGLQGYQWPEGARVVIERVEAKPQSNAGLEILEPPATAAGTEDAIHVRVSNSSDSKKEKFNLAWKGGGERMEIYLTPGQTRTFTAPKPPAGTKSGALELSGDDLDYDNVSYYAAPETRHVTVYCANLGKTNDPTGMLYYLQRVFPNTPRRQVEFSPDLTDRASFAVVTGTLAPEQTAALRAYLNAGKPALLILSGAGASSTLAALLGVAETQVTEAGGDFALLGSIDFQHPIFKPFDDPRYSDFSNIHFWKHRRWQVPASAQVHVLAKFDDNSPALAQMTVGKGQLLVLASGWNPADSQLAVSSKFPPLLETMFDWSGASAPARCQFRAGETIPGAPLEKTDTPGIHTLALKDNKKRVVAVNIPLEESRVAPMSPDELARLGAPLKWDTEKASAATLIHQQRLQDAELENRQKLWRWLIVAALAVTFAEIVLSGWLARRVATAGATS